METITINKGTSFYHYFDVLDDNGSGIDLSGYTGRGMLKLKYSDTGYLADFDVVLDAPVSGQAFFSLTPTQTSTLPITKGVYDIEAFNATGVLKLNGGFALINPEATY